MRQTFEGDLLKFTNAFQGWQHRWFVLDPVHCELRYYLKQDFGNGGQKPRGVFSLIDAQVVPSEDDSLAFTVFPNKTSGHEIPCRLKAADSKIKQEWIDHLRTAIEEYKKCSNKPTRSAVQLAENVRRGLAKEGELFQNLHKILNAYADQQRNLSRTVDNLPVSSTNGCLDPSILSLKSNSSSLLTCLEQCVHALKDIQTLSHQARTEDIFDEHNESNSTTAFPSVENIPETIHK